jgi:membrane associated rhomboid family serine protease
MNPWICASLITLAGAIGGVVNALLTDNGFVKPRVIHNIWCPGAISNILIGAFSAFSSWAFYGSGASVELTQLNERTAISLRFSALAGAFLVGVAGARWLTNEVDKRLLRESVVEAGKKNLSAEDCQRIVKAPAREVLKALEQS